MMLKQMDLMMPVEMATPLKAVTTECAGHRKYIFVKKRNQYKVLIKDIIARQLHYQYLCCFPNFDIKIPGKKVYR